MSLSLDQDAILDLFGDQTHVQIPSAPVLQGTSRRVDQLSSDSCCQRIAYSREGIIATIASDSKSFYIHALKRNTRNSTWDLNQPISICPELGENVIVHISWSPLGGELAVVDDAGRVRIYKTHHTSGRLKLHYVSSNDENHDLTAVACLFWLSVEPHVRMTGTCWSASRAESRWTYEMKNHLTPLGTCNPLPGQNSFLLITKGGALKLFFADPDGHWLERSISLDITENEDFITHAVFGLQPRDPMILLATYDIARRLKVYRIRIDWNFKPPAKPTKDNPGPVVLTAPNPILDFQAVILEDSCCPSTLTVDQNGNPVLGIDNLNAYQLTHLDFVPYLPDKPLQHPYPTIMATFASQNTSSPLIYDRHHNASSVICRWHYKTRNEISQESMAIFDEIPTIATNHRASVDGKVVKTADIKVEAFYLERLPDNYLHSVVLSQWILRSGTLVAFALLDGSIEFRFRDSMELASADGNYEEVSTLPQFGFVFPHEEPTLHIALSPNHCCAITMDDEGDVKLRRMECSEDLGKLKEDQPQFEALTALLALCVTSSILGYTGHDDLLAILPQNLSFALASAISEQLFVACAPIGGRVDYTQAQQQELLMFITKSSSARSLLSFTNALSPMKKGRPSTGANVCFTILNMRIVWYHLSKGIQDERFWTPETALTLVGNSKWFWALLCYIINELNNLSWHLQDKIKDRQALEEYIRTNSTPVLHLVLCSLSRRLILFLCQVLYKQFLTTNKKLQVLRQQQGDKALFENEANRKWTIFMNIYKQCPLVHAVIQEKSAMAIWLGQIDAAVNQCYGAANRDERGRTEAAMLVRGTIPEQLFPAVSVLFESLTRLQTQTDYDAGLLYRYDTAWLGLGPYTSKKVIDVLKKKEMMRASEVKYCPRCGSVSEEYGPEYPPPFWLHQSLKHCMCGVLWAFSKGEREDEV